MERTYETQAGCPVAATLDVIGDRWTILILRDLGLGKSGKFKDLLESLEGVSPNLLASRLKKLHREGIIERFFYSDHPPRAEYRLTEKGQELRPVIRALGEWGYKHQLTDDQREGWLPPWREDGKAPQPTRAEDGVSDNSGTRLAT